MGGGGGVRLAPPDIASPAFPSAALVVQVFPSAWLARHVRYITTRDVNIDAKRFPDGPFSATSHSAFS